MEYDYDSLLSLAAVIREGGFDAAAKSLNVTQSAVSQRIKQLEDKVGSLLIVRGRPCVPTELGLHLCQHVEQVTLLQHELNDRISSLVDGETSSPVKIRITVNNDSIASWFPNVIKRAVQDLRVQLEIIPDDQEHTEKSLTSGNSLAVVTSHEKPIQGCRRISLGAMEYIAVASTEFYNAHFANGVSLDTIKGTACLAFDRKDTIQAQWMALCFGTPTATLTHMVPSYEGYLACCLNGTGWGIVPAVAGEQYLRSGKLIELVPNKRIKVSLHWQSSTQSSEILRRLGDIVLEEAQVHLMPDDFRTV
ncbi:MAG: LysR family transcriptional regulator ArgP [Yoonia sp.]|uniref:LysR family transcriptional regulator ArgP n=1 Tax=Yoonia sp. TaxID=2212373 RepID=UPI00273CFF8B|nr:LysR family transcriptional regulator ArgP [Yoonia sp.]MDP5083775.1 LysR family transcriptional regulator ArgP [Yoonia sp.]